MYDVSIKNLRRHPAHKEYSGPEGKKLIQNILKPLFI
jgi:hypothetical protein